MLKRILNLSPRSLTYALYAGIALMLLILLAIWHEGFRAVTSTDFWTR